MLLQNLCNYAVGNTNVTESAQLPAEFLTAMIEVEDRRPEPSRLSEDSEYVHVSSLIDLCPRQYAIARSNNMQLTNTPRSADRIVWEIGKSLERHVVKNLKSYHGEGFVKSNENILNVEYNITGAPDIELTIDTDTVVISEVKSINKRDFDKLERPLGDHILQAALYRWLFNEYNIEYNLPERAHNIIILLYVAKDYCRGSPYKEFHIDSATVQSGVDLCLELAAELKEAREADRIPRRHICDREDCARSKKCPVSHLCWSLPEEEYETTA